MGQSQSTDQNGTKETVWRLGPFYFKKTKKSTRSSQRSNYASSSSFANADPIIEM